MYISKASNNTFCYTTEILSQKGVEMHTLIDICYHCTANVLFVKKQKFDCAFPSCALDKVLHDSKYTETAQKLGSVLNDQITRPKDRVVWWVEHLMKHPNSTLYFEQIVGP